MLLAVVLLLPFAGKAYTIDDTLFLRQAEHALADPLHPSSFEVVWSEFAYPLRLSQLMPNGPLMAWLLVPAVLAGGSEIVAHGVQLVLLLVAILEVAVLAARMGYDEEIARLASLLLAGTPAVLGMAATAMPDVAAMTFSLVGIERLYAWRDERRWHQAVLAAAGLGLAPLARTHVLLLVGLAPFILRSWVLRSGFLRAGFPGPVFPKTRDQWRAWIPVAAAPLVTFGLLRLTADPLGASADIASSTGLYSSLANVRSNALAFAVHQVLLLPSGLAWMLVRGRDFWKSPLTWAALAVAFAGFASGHDMRWLWLAPVAGLGIAVVADIVRVAASRPDADRVVLALWMLVALPVVVYLHFPSKYLVPCAPAAAILAASALWSLPRRLALGAGGAIVVAGAVLGTLIVQADASLANLGRRAVDELVRPRVAAGENVWFTTHWGFQWYAERAGARPVTVTAPHPVPGDYLVSSQVTATGVSVQAFRGRQHVAMVTDASPGGRIVSAELGAGFYSNGWGYLPWAWGSQPVDRFDLWRLR